MQLVELAYRSAPRIQPAALAERAAAILGESVDLHDGAADSRAVSIFHRSHPVTYEDGKQAPPSTTLLGGDKGCDPADYTAEIQQSWSCRDADQLLADTTHATLVTEMMARTLPTKDRMRLYHGVLQAAVELDPPAALICKHSQMVITPDDYLQSCDGPIWLRAGACNVRMFNISNTDGEMVMDTRGLEEVGLHDLQCHFRGLDPNAVAGMLHNLAMYLLDRGPVIESGHTIPGIEPDSKWRCQFEESLVEPTRQLLDLDPGSPHAAGDR